MVDVFSDAKRSEVMAQIKSRHTRPELAVRSILHGAGFRFRLHRKDLPGSPDIVLPKYHTVIFVHGCFWHRHKGCKYAYTPKSRIDFWLSKFESNVKRDRHAKTGLRALGWSVLVVWECETKDKQRLERRLIRILSNRI